MRDPRVEAVARAIHARFGFNSWEDEPQAALRAIRHYAQEVLVAADAAAWQPIETAPKNGTPILAKIHDDLFPRVKPNRPDLKSWNGQEIAVRHPGILEDGFDLGWGMCAPVGCGGFPDEWLSGWRYVGPCVPPEVGHG